MSWIAKICGKEPAVKFDTDRSCNCQCTSNCCCPIIKRHEADCRSKTGKVSHKILNDQNMDLSQNKRVRKYHLKKKKRI